MRYKDNTIFSNTKLFVVFFSEKNVQFSYFFAAHLLRISSLPCFLFRVMRLLHPAVAAVAVNAVNHQRDGAVTRHIAGGAKAVHRDV